MSNPPTSDACVIREARPEDVPVLAEFNRAMAAETEAKQLDLEVLSRGIRRLIDEPQHGFYRVAELQQDVVGAVMVTFEWSDWRDGQFWWLQSVYVKPASRRLGVFRQLYQSVRQDAESLTHVCGLRLYVERDNSRAMETYRSLGMKQTPYQLFEVEFTPS